MPRLPSRSASPAAEGRHRALGWWLVALAGFTLTGSTHPAPAIYVWGLNSHGQLGISNLDTAPKPQRVVLPSGADPVAVSAGSYDSFAIASNGQLFAWGANQYGQLGDGTTADRAHPEPVR